MVKITRNMFGRLPNSHCRNSMELLRLSGAKQGVVQRCSTIWPEEQKLDEAVERLVQGAGSYQVNHERKRTRTVIT